MKAKQSLSSLIVVRRWSASGWWWMRSRPARRPVRQPTAWTSRGSSTSARSRPRERESLTPERLAEYSQEEVDQIYGRLTAGPIPDGAYDGDLFFPRGTDSETRLGEIIGGPLKSRLANLGVRKTEGLGRLLWKGKVFYRNERLLRNRIEDLAVLAPLTGGNTDGIEKLTVNGRDTFLLFPGEVVLRSKPARRPAGVGDHRLRVHRRAARLPRESRRARRAQWVSHPRRDPHGAARFLSRPRVSEPHLRLELHARTTREAEAAGRADFRAGRVAEDCWAGTQVARR